jgi:hypothetical protein
MTTAPETARPALDLLPNFFVIGAPRSGTTSLYEYLDAHPDVAMSTVKEPDFFSLGCLDAVHPLGQPGPATLEEAATADPVLAEKLAAYLDLFSRVRDESRVGEASAVYLGHPTAAWHLRAYRPDARFVVILRDPAERAHSHYVHGRRIYAEHGQMEAIGAPGRSVDEEWTRAVDAAVAGGMPDPAVSDPDVWVRSGYYHSHLSRWYSLFPKDQLLVFLYEDLVDDAAALMRRTYEFLGVDPSFALPTTEAFNASVVPRNRRLFTLFTTRNTAMRWARGVAPPRVRGLAVRTRNRVLGRGKPGMDPELHRKLRAIYREDTLALHDLLGRDLSAWLAPQ